MVVTIENFVLEIEQEDNKKEFLEIEIRLPDSKIIEERKNLGTNEISSKRKSDRIMDRLNISPKIHKNIITKMLKKICFGVALFIETT